MENKPQFFTNALNISFCGAKTGNMHLKRSMKLKLMRDILWFHP